MGLSSIDQSFVDAAWCRFSPFLYTDRDAQECVNQALIIQPTSPSGPLRKHHYSSLARSFFSTAFSIFLRLVGFIDWRNWLDRMPAGGDWMSYLGW